MIALLSDDEETQTDLDGIASFAVMRQNHGVRGRALRVKRISPQRTRVDRPHPDGRALWVAGVPFLVRSGLLRLAGEA